MAYNGSLGFKYGTGLPADESTDESILRCIKHYIEALYRTDQHTRIVKLLYELDKRGTLVEDMSLWTVFLRAQYNGYYNVSIFEKLGKITRILGDEILQGFLRASLEKAASLDADSVADDQFIWLAFQAAEWQYPYAFQPDESTELLEKIIALIDQGNEVVQQSEAPYRTRASQYLGMIHFNAAKTALNAGTDSSAHIAKLEKLAKHKQGSEQYYRASYPALTLGMWLHDHSKIDEESWRACIRPSVKQALYLLSDEDPWNDQSAYAQRSQALLLAGDTLNASIALGITTQPLEEHRNLPHLPKEEDQPEEEEDLNQDKLSSTELVPIEMVTADEKSGTNTEKSADPQVKEPNKFFDQDVSNHDEEDKAPSSVPEKCSAGEEGGMGNDTESLASPFERGDGESNEESDSINPKLYPV